MILELHRQGLSVSEIARQTGHDRKTVAKYIERGLEPPAYTPRPPQPRLIEPYEVYLKARVTAYPGLSGKRLFREIKENGYTGGYTAVTDYLREIRPEPARPFEVRFETPPGAQAQVDFARFPIVFTDEPTEPRIVWLFSMVLGSSRLIWARFVEHQNCLVPERDGIRISDSASFREELWDRYFTAAPRPLTPSERQYSDRRLRSRSSPRNTTSIPRRS